MGSEQIRSNTMSGDELVAFINSVPVGLGIYSVQNGHLSLEYLNDAYYRMLGEKREDREVYEGLNTIVTVHPDDISTLEQGLKRMEDGADEAQFEMRIKKSDNSYMWMRVVAAVVERGSERLKVYAAFFDSTKRKSQELIIAENQKAVQLAQEQGGVSIFTYDIDAGTIFQLTGAGNSDYLGYPDQVDNVPRCFIDNNQVHPDDIETFLSIYERIGQGEETADGIYRLKDAKTGEYHWIHMFYRVMDTNADEHRFAAGCGLYVDEQQEAIQRYQEEQHLRDQMFANSIMTAEYNLTKGCIERMTPEIVETREALEQRTEETYRRVLSERVEDAYLDDMASTMFWGNLLTRFKEGVTRLSCDARSKNLPGFPSHWYRSTVVLEQRPGSGDVIAFAYVQDIEDEKEDELAIEKCLVQGSEGILIIDVNTSRAHFVRNTIMGTEHKKTQEFDYDDDFVRASSAVVAQDQREASITAGLLSTVVQQLQVKDDYLYFITTQRGNNPVKRQSFHFRYLDDRRQKLVLTVDDVTAVYEEEQRNKRDLEVALAQAEESNRDKAAFYARMSHDMRTPMNGILGMTALARNENDVAALKDGIAKIEESGEYLLSLINDTLDLQRIESGKMTLEPKVVSAKVEIENILSMVKASADANGVELAFDRGNTGLDSYVRLDPVRVKQVFVNLLSNAVKFTPRGGIVKLSIEILKREGMISHSVIRVIDSGIGMSKEFLDNSIFSPFSQESNEYSARYAGSGLGLSIAKSLVDLMGGRIEVTSELGSGTTFSVYLDLERVNREQVEEVKEAKKGPDDFKPQLMGKKIMLVEDNPLNAEIASKLLEMVGCVVTRAVNGREAVTLFENSPIKEFDAVLMDIRMPIMDGLEAARAIRALDRSDAATTPILAMTANTYKEDIEDSLAAGMNAHLGKPVDIQKLYETLSEFV